jgi:hypothetical protein
MIQTVATIFLAFELPNATTWFYFSLILALAFFVKFSRLLSIRNWDVLSLFLLVPGLLLLEEGQTTPREPPSRASEGASETKTVHANGNVPNSLRWFGYVWLLAGSFYFLVRCVVDLALVRRPVLTPNLSVGGLAWFGGALLVALIVVAVRPADGPASGTGRESAALVQLESGVETAAKKAARGVTGTDVRFVASRALAIVCHLAIVAALVVIGWRHFQDIHAGMAAAVCYLLLPYTALKGSQLPHVLPMALVLWAVVFYRRPGLAGLFLGLAAGAVYFPLLLLPLWLGFYWGRGAGRFLAFFGLAAGVYLAAVGLTLWMQGDLAASLKTALDLSDWQAWKAPTTEGFWTGIHWAYRIPVFIAYLVFLVATTLWPAPKNLAHVLALSAAVLIGIQFWYADQGGEYVLWYLPLLLLLVFRPNLSDRRPPLIVPETDRLVAVGRWIGRRLRRLLLGRPGLVRAG